MNRIAVTRIRQPSLHADLWLYTGSRNTDSLAGNESLAVEMDLLVSFHGSMADPEEYVPLSSSPVISKTLKIHNRVVRPQHGRVEASVKSA